MAVVVSNPSSFPSEGNCSQTGAFYCRLSCAVLLEAVNSPSCLLLLLLPSQQLFLDQAGCLLLGVCVWEPWDVPFQDKVRRFLPLEILHCCDLLRDVKVPEEGVPQQGESWCHRINGIIKIINHKIIKLNHQPIAWPQKWQMAKYYLAPQLFSCQFFAGKRGVRNQEELSHPFHCPRMEPTLFRFVLVQDSRVRALLFAWTDSVCPTSTRPLCTTLCNESKYSWIGICCSP